MGDAERFWNRRYLTRLRALNLAISSLVVGNIALCATEHNKYPKSMFRMCWKMHSSRMLETVRPAVVILMGAESVMGRFQEALSASGVPLRVVRMAHFAHREGHAFEAAECERVKAFLAISY
jgi:hypothetical protein